MRNWKIGDSFRGADDSAVYVILSMDSEDCEYVQVNNSSMNCPILVVRALDTLNYYEKEGYIVYLGNVRVGW
jgi:hypothetical protein